MVDEKIVIILLLAVFGIVLAVINSKREVNKMRIEKDARDDTKVSALTKAINEKWHTADVSDAEELTRDLMALLASFSGKYYGRRSLERRKQNKNDNRDK